MSRTINVSLGITLCTDPENRNFIRVGVEALGIDLDGDVEAQAQGALKCSLEVLTILDDGLKEAVTDIVMGSAKPGLVRDALAGHDEKFIKIGRVMATALRRLDKLEEGKGEEVEGV